MDETCARALTEIVALKGREVLDDARRCTALLQDFSPSTRREITALIEAIKGGIPRRLLALPSASLTEGTVAKLGEGLMETTALSEEAARWAVRAYATALGLSIQQSKQRPPPVAPASPAASAVKESRPPNDVQQPASKPAGETRSPPVSNLAQFVDPQVSSARYFASLAVGLPKTLVWLAKTLVWPLLVWPAAIMLAALAVGGLGWLYAGSKCGGSEACTNYYSSHFFYAGVIIAVVVAVIWSQVRRQ
jgi:hypothetical protein